MGFFILGLIITKTKAAMSRTSKTLEYKINRYFGMIFETQINAYLNIK